MGTWNSWTDTAQRLFEPLGGDVNNDNAPWWDIGGNLQKDPGAKTEAARKAMLYDQAKQAGSWANQNQNQVAQNQRTGRIALEGLQRQANGENSVSAEQLRQGLQQNLAGQRSLAASASPQNSAMAARTAAIQSGRLGTGLAGQQAVAGLQERNQAQSQYGSLLGQLSGQANQAAIASRSTAVQGYGSADAGQPEKSNVDKYGNAIVGGLAAIFSDRRLKTDVRDGDAAASQIASALPSATFRYKDPKFGGGDQLGVMAQDLQGVGLGQAVVDTPHGKVVNGAKLATANTAMIGALARRLSQVEQGSTPPPPPAYPSYAASEAPTPPTPELLRRRAAMAAQMMAQRHAAQAAQEQALMRRAQQAPIPYTSAVGRSWGSDSSVVGADMGGQ